MSSPLKYTSLCFAIVAVYLLACMSDKPITSSEETKEDAVRVQAFTVTFDSTTMNAKLQWAASDTSAITMYAVYRVSSSGMDTMLLVDKSLTSCTDDLIMADGDSVTYQIAAIGKNNQEGSRTKAEKFVVRGMVHCIAKIDLKTLTQQRDYIRQVYSDKGDVIYLIIVSPAAENEVSILKISSQGKLLRKFQNNRYGEKIGLGFLQHDDTGNLYIEAAYSDSTKTHSRFTILKLDADLNILAEHSMDQILEPFPPYSQEIIVTGNSSVFLFGNSEHFEPYQKTTITRLTPDLTGIDTQFTIDRPLYNTSRYGNTFITFEFYDSIINGHRSWSVGHINCYDTAFTQLSTSGHPVLDEQYWIPSFRNTSINDEGLIGAPHGVIASLRRDNISGTSINTQLLFTNTSGKLLARTVFNAYPEFYFDTAEHLYCYSYSDYEDVDDPETLYIYTMAPLYAKAGN